MAIDVSRLTEGVTLSQEVSASILADTLENSAFQSLATKIDMPAQGVSWQTITGEPEAGWVNETDEKPVSRPSFGSDTVQPYKMAVIVPFSDEFRRDAGRLFAEVQRRIPYALGRLFDRTVLGLTAAPGEHFDQLDGVQEVTYDGTDADSAYDSLLDVDAAISDNGHLLDGWALAPRARNTLMRVRVDGSPLFTAGVQSGDVYGTLLGGRVEYRKALAEDAERVLCVQKGGVCIAAHIDRESNGIAAILGCVPDELNFSSVELSKKAPPDLAGSPLFFLRYPSSCGSLLRDPAHRTRCFPQRGSQRLPPRAAEHSVR